MTGRVGDREVDFSARGAHPRRFANDEPPDAPAVPDSGCISSPLWRAALCASASPGELR